MRVDDFFTETEVPVQQNDPWGIGATTSTGVRFVQHFDHEMVSKLRQGRLVEWADTEVAVALCQLVHGELEAYGTGGGERLTEDEIAIAIRALVAVTKRLGVDFDPPYRNFTSFRG